MQAFPIRRLSHVQPEAPTISLDQPGRLLTRHVLALSGWSHSTLYARIARGAFPLPQKDGRSNYWRTQDVKSALRLGSDDEATSCQTGNQDRSACASVRLLSTTGLFAVQESRTARGEDRS